MKCVLYPWIFKTEPILASYSMNIIAVSSIFANFGMETHPCNTIMYQCMKMGGALLL